MQEGCIIYDGRYPSLCRASMVLMEDSLYESEKNIREVF